MTRHRLSVWLEAVEGITTKESLKRFLNSECEVSLLCEVEVLSE